MLVSLDPTDCYPTIELSNDNLTAEETGTSGWNSVRGTVGYTEGQFYFEVTINALAAYIMIGAADDLMSLGGFVGSSPGSIGIMSVNGQTYTNGSATGIEGTPSFGTGDIISVAVNLNTNQIWFRKNGGPWNNNALNNPATGYGTVIGFYPTGPVYPAVSGYTVGDEVTCNFGGTPFAYSPPSSAPVNFIAFQSGGNSGVIGVPPALISYAPVPPRVFAPTIIAPLSPATAIAPSIIGNTTVAPASATAETVVPTTVAPVNLANASSPGVPTNAEGTPLDEGSQATNAEGELIEDGTGLLPDGQPAESDGVAMAVAMASASTSTLVLVGLAGGALAAAVAAGFTLGEAMLIAGVTAEILSEGLSGDTTFDADTSSNLGANIAGAVAPADSPGDDGTGFGGAAGDN